MRGRLYYLWRSFQYGNGALGSQAGEPQMKSKVPTDHYRDRSLLRVTGKELAPEEARELWIFEACERQSIYPGSHPILSSPGRQLLVLSSEDLIISNFFSQTLCMGAAVWFWAILFLAVLREKKKTRQKRRDYMALTVTSPQLALLSTTPLVISPATHLPWC